MKNPALHFAALFATALLLCGCAPRREAFDENALLRYGRTGSGTIIGTAFRTTNDNSVMTQNHLGTVRLMPATAYTEEEVQRTYWNGHRLTPADSRLAKYIREVHPDDDGHFAFHHVPPGDYYVCFRATWTYPTTTTDADGNTMDIDAETNQWMYTRLTIKNGEKWRIDGWNQGS